MEVNVLLQSDANIVRKEIEASFAICQVPSADHKLFIFFPSTKYTHSHPRTSQNVIPL